jgi:hypothetical protein
VKPARRPRKFGRRAGFVFSLHTRDPSGLVRTLRDFVVAPDSVIVAL